MRPYLIIPQLIKQPTWGGDYIPKLKNLTTINDAIGQSYELTATSNLAKEITDSNALGAYNGPTITLTDLLLPNESMPLLIKLNQARGNSFQLHIKPDVLHALWKPKPESWYFLEKGYITLGLKPHTSIHAYKDTCQRIETYMAGLSQQVLDNNLSLLEAREQAGAFISKQNPWQYVNQYHIAQYDLIDLSMGGIHHSWEEDSNNPIGNVVYEVQIDATDDESTMRSFDQGKMKDDGTIRELSINDYFQHIDTNPTHNTLAYLKRTPQEEVLLHTAYYILKKIEISGMRTLHNKGLWHHLYVERGSIELIGGDVTLHITAGHSCFVPAGTSKYTVASADAVVLLTHLP